MSLRDDDDDIDALISQSGVGGASAPAADLAEEMAPKRGRARGKASPKVAELSAKLTTELQKPAPASPVDMAAIIAQHIAREPGPARVLDVTADEYHELPGLSSTIAGIIVDKSPLHARAQHALFGGGSKAPTKAMDRGTVVHALVLGKGKEFVAVDADDWRTNAAKEARDAAREVGLVPMLSRDLEAAQETAAAITRQLPEHGVHLAGVSELAIEWWEQAGDELFVRCRGMLDHCIVDRGRILDLKIVGDASPSNVERSAENFGYAIQRAAYTRGLAALRPDLAGRIDFLFAFCEADPPHAINVSRPDGAFRELGDRRWERAVSTWGRCLTTNVWPGYGQTINQLTSPTWALSREEFASL